MTASRNTDILLHFYATAKLINLVDWYSDVLPYILEVSVVLSRMTMGGGNNYERTSGK